MAVAVARVAGVAAVVVVVVVAVACAAARSHRLRRHRQRLLTDQPQSTVVQSVWTSRRRTVRGCESNRRPLPRACLSDTRSSLMLSAFVPCGHRCCCGDCAAAVLRANKLCPMCAAPAEMACQIYGAD